MYAGAQEIHQYFENFKVKYGLDQYCKTSHQVLSTKWEEENGGWDVEVKDLLSDTIFKDFCHILINANGAYNQWRWPSIKGLHSFQGPLLHTAHWDTTIDLTGKRVGLIGNGYCPDLVLITSPQLRLMRTMAGPPDFRY